MLVLLSADPAASSQGSRDALGQGMAAESAAESSGGQWVTKPRPPACYVEQEVTTAERGQSAATNLVQRVVAGVPRASTAGPHAGEQAAHIGVDGQSVWGTTALATTTTNRRELTAARLVAGVPRASTAGPHAEEQAAHIGVDGQSVWGTTALAMTTTNRRELTAAELLKQKRAIFEEDSKVLEERIEEEQREAAKAAAIAAAIDAAVAATAAAAELKFPKDSLVTSGGLELFPPVPGQESPPAYRSRSKSGSFVTAGSSSEAARRSPEAASEVGEASRIAAEVEERWRAVKLVEEQLAAREAALKLAEQAQAQAAGQPVALPNSIHIPPHEERLQVVAAQATELAGVRRPATSSTEPEWSSCASTEGDRVMEFGEQLAAQWTVQAQEQQQELAVKVLAAQAETAERHMQG